jgi:hypothetical protein
VWAIEQAVNACPTNGLLVRTAMEIEIQAGDREAAERRSVTRMCVSGMTITRPTADTPGMARAA